MHLILQKLQDSRKLHLLNRDSNKRYKKMELENGFSPYPDFKRTYNSQTLSQRLVFPNDYRKYYPKPLPEKAILKSPQGQFWTVKWKTTQEDTVSFEDGWSKFVKDNDLLDGDFILFTYDGSRSFWVRIYRNGFIVKSKTPIQIQEISSSSSSDDDDMETKEDSDENNIISLSLDNKDEDDDDVTMMTEVNKSQGAGSSKRKRAASIDNPETYLDDPKNPCFISTSSCVKRMLVIAKRVIKDYDLKFGGKINFIDDFGEVEGDVRKWQDRVVIYNWDVIYKRNYAKADQDVIICEILREDDAVKSIKVHFVKK